MVSIPKNAGAVPYYYNHKLKSGGTPIAYHFGSKYSFGYGLSYTRFEYSSLTIKQGRVNISDGTIALSLKLENTGEREGCEVIQVYVRDLYASLVRPVKELKAFKRVGLQPGQRAEVSFAIPVDMLNFTNRNNQRMVEAGEFEIMVGASSSDIRLKGRVEVVGENRVLDRDWRMESQAHVQAIPTQPKFRIRQTVCAIAAVTSFFGFFAKSRRPGRSIGSRRHTGSFLSIELLPETPREVFRLHPQFRHGSSLQQAPFLRAAQSVQVRYPFPVHVVNDSTHADVNAQKQRIGRDQPAEKQLQHQRILKLVIVAFGPGAVHNVTHLQPPWFAPAKLHEFNL